MPISQMIRRASVWSHPCTSRRLQRSMVARCSLLNTQSPFTTASTHARRDICRTSRNLQISSSSLLIMLIAKYTKKDTARRSGTSRRDSSHATISIAESDPSSSARDHTTHIAEHVHISRIPACLRPISPVCLQPQLSASVFLHNLMFLL